MIIEAKVPLKLTLFGEHAVVYNKPAIAFTISEYIKVRIKPSEKFVIRSNELSIKGIKVDLHEFKIENEEIKKLLRYIIEATNYFEKKEPVEIEVESTVQPSVGLGTSAAVIVGTVAAYSKFLGINLTKEEIAKISHQIELRVQGLGSRMDTYTETLGGFIYFPPQEGFERISTSLEFTAGYFPRIMTTAEMLYRVKTLKEKRSKLFSMILDSIEEIVMQAREALVRNDLQSVGELMYYNHGLLNAIGVTSPVIDNLVSTAKILGISGCKMSGGGGGGAVICTNENESRVLIKSFGGKIINSKPTFEGVNVSFLT
ncbi:MAG: mevalonate kinase [Sulfolobaceae archaeon]